MLAGQFIRGRTPRELAAAWGLTYQALRDISAEASRRVRAELNGDHVAVYAAEKLERIADDVKVEPRDRVAALKLLVEISGAAMPAKHDVSVTAMTPEQARERLRELAPDVLAALK
jgi:hypothetical protein